MKVLANDGISQSGVDALEAAGFEVITTACNSSFKILKSSNCKSVFSALAIKSFKNCPRFENAVILWFKSINGLVELYSGLNFTP